MNIALSISAEVNDGLRGFHVIYRPIVDSKTRRKADAVRSNWFPIVDKQTQQKAWKEAVACAAEANETDTGLWPERCPHVNWEDLAKRAGDKLRRKFVHPTRNASDEQRIKEMLDAEFSAISIAEEFGVSRKTVYKWKKRFSEAEVIDGA